MNGEHLDALHDILSAIQETNRILKRQFNRVLGGVMSQIGDPMNPIQPGNTVKFQVTPTFSGPPFPLVAENAAISSSDTTNFPVSLDTADDPTGATFESVIPSTATPVGGAESVTVTWAYTNIDGTQATVTGTVTEDGITDDVTGGTFAQVV